MDYPEEPPWHLSPSCCKASLNARTVFLAHRDYDYDLIHGVPPSWFTKGRAEITSTTESREQKYKDGKPDGEPITHTHTYTNVFDNCYVPASFCPFCGAAMPKIRMKKKQPKPIRKITDCNTCKERGHACVCLPEAAKWEEDK